MTNSEIVDSVMDRYYVVNNTNIGDVKYLSQREYVKLVLESALLIKDICNKYEKQELDKKQILIDGVMKLETSEFDNGDDVYQMIALDEVIKLITNILT
jgi:hypothetical protein